MRDTSCVLHSLLVFSLYFFILLLVFHLRRRFLVLLLKCQDLDYIEQYIERLDCNMLVESTRFLSCTSPLYLCLST